SVHRQGRGRGQGREQEVGPADGGGQEEDEGQGDAEGDEGVLGGEFAAAGEAARRTARLVTPKFRSDSQSSSDRAAASAGIRMRTCCSTVRIRAGISGNCCA